MGFRVGATSVFGEEPHLGVSLPLVAYQDAPLFDFPLR
jgi:hypothetical protein